VVEAVQGVDLGDKLLLLTLLHPSVIQLLPAQYFPISLPLDLEYVSEAAFIQTKV